MQIALRDVVTCARKWAAARARCRRIADSKRASEVDLTRAKKALGEASDDLARAVEVLERALLRGGGKPKKPVNWHKVFDAVGTFASAVESAVREKPPIVVGVIDTTGEEVGVSGRRRGR